MTPIAREQSLFVLFISSGSINSETAIANVERALKFVNLSARDVEVIDVHQQPDVALASHIFVTPTLLRRSRIEPRMVGDLSSFDQLTDFLR